MLRSILTDSQKSVGGCRMVYNKSNKWKYCTNERYVHRMWILITTPRNRKFKNMYAWISWFAGLMIVKSNSFLQFLHILLHQRITTSHDVKYTTINFLMLFRLPTYTPPYQQRNTSHVMTFWTFHCAYKEA